jgi:hypothetical protein
MGARGEGERRKRERNRRVRKKVQDGLSESSLNG